MNLTDKFTADLAACLGLDIDKAERLATILEERIDELAEQKASKALDREFNRGDYRY